MKLNEELNELLKSKEEVFQQLVPGYIRENLKPSFELRPYQLEAFGRFVYYNENYRKSPNPTQLLFHMATGSGKTLIMAGLMIYLYQQGYRNFLFFVNSTNIIDKTKDNFLNANSIKYLFSERLSIADKKFEIAEVSNFQDTNQDNINICFSTVQGLHALLNTPKENEITFDDFENSKVVLIADEAHHINADTKNAKKRTPEEQENIDSWEGTVTRIFNANKENIMLEFTATADLKNPLIAFKYDNKLLFDYPLSKFRAEGYSKDVQTLQATLPVFERAVQAIILSQYRQKLFEKYGIRIKPVVLFKSKTIKESKDFQTAFTENLKHLNAGTLQNIKNLNRDTVLRKVFDYLEKNSIPLENFCEELKDDFAADKQISVNSREESEEKQIAINTLENEKNIYRAIFAVDKLNEGWDVLNLFDIVRLYDTRDSKNGVPGKTTMQEAQLIGRGARYCPFRVDGIDNAYIRKFDEDTENELKICEELYYHASYNPGYIVELNRALVNMGIKPVKLVQRQLNLKEEFKNTDFYRNGFILKNHKEKNTRANVFSLKSSILEQVFEAKINSETVEEKEAFTAGKRNDTKNITEQEYFLPELGEIIIREAMSRLEFYRFDNLKKYLPNLKSVSEFITSNNYLGKIRVKIKAEDTDLNNISSEEKLRVTINLLNTIAPIIGSDKIESIGSKDFTAFAIKEVFKSKQMNFTLDGKSDREFGKSMLDESETKMPLNINEKQWYAQEDCFGTSEEKSFVLYINSIYEELKAKYEEIYLLRNERDFQLHAFYDGRAFEPDFVLFLSKNNNGKKEYTQVFVEPKGPQLIERDGWKERFLNEISSQSTNTANIRLLAMPFYCFEDDKKLNEFKSTFEKAILG